MSIKTRQALMRALSALPDGPLVDEDRVVDALDQDPVLLLLWFAAEVCGTEPKSLSAEDLMRHLAENGRAR